MSFVSRKSSAWLLFCSVFGCGSRAHVIAEACPGAGIPGPVGTCGASGAGGIGSSDPGLTLALDLSTSGTARFGDTLSLGGGSMPALLALRGELATSSAWPVKGGGSLSAVSAGISPALPAPFTDGSGAVGLSSPGAAFRASDASLGDVGADDFAIEVVLRAEPNSVVAQKQDSLGGWSLASRADGTLSLSLAGATISSEPLTANAWYHCLFWVNRPAGGRADCNGRPGAPADLSGLSAASSGAALAVGGSAAMLELGWLAIFSMKDAASPSLDELTAASRARFLQLTGAFPRIAAGSALPASALRNSPAFLDLESAGVRHLFLVGPDWPRIACRADLAGARLCGYLSEPERTRFLPANASAWTAQEVSLAATADAFTENEDDLSGLVPSVNDTAHSLTFSGAFGGARQVLSFFARAASGHLLAVSVGNLAAASFDLSAGSVLTTPPGVIARIEPFGAGSFRCSYVFTPANGELDYRLALLADDASSAFSGDGASAAVEIGGLQLDVGQADAGTLLAADLQPADALTFVGDDGNLPGGTAVTAALQTLIPRGPRLNDEALLSLNLNGDFANQVELYVTGDGGELKFWGLQGGDTHWAFDHPAPFTDGKWHAVVASWDKGSAVLTVDGVALTEAALSPNLPAFSLNRIDVGFSSSSSGSLDGLVSRLEIGVASP